MCLYRLINKLEPEILLNNIKNFHLCYKGPGLSTLQRPATVVLFRKKLTFCSEYSSKHITIFCGPNVVLFIIWQLTVAISLQVFKISPSVMFGPCLNSSAAPAKFLSRYFDLTPVMSRTCINVRCYYKAR
jgi:hypothetical protein